MKKSVPFDFPIIGFFTFVYEEYCIHQKIFGDAFKY